MRPVTLTRADAPTPRHDPPSPAGARRRLLVLGTVLLTAALMAAGGWWITHPSSLQPVSGSIDGPVEVGSTAAIGMFTQSLDSPVHLLGATPVVTSNSADAEVRILLCHHAAGEDTVGAARGSAEQLCTATSAPRDASLGLRSTADGAYLLLEVSPRRPGTVTVDGVKVRYRDGLQWGEQVSGVVATLHAS